MTIDSHSSENSSLSRSISNSNGRTAFMSTPGGNHVPECCGDGNGLTGNGELVESASSLSPPTPTPVGEEGKFGVSSGHGSLSNENEKDSNSKTGIRIKIKTLYDALNPSERELVSTFRSAILSEFPTLEGDPNSPGLDDTTLIRFLRARSFQLKPSLAMYSACVQWRRSVLGVGMDELCKRTNPWDYPEREEVFSKWPIWFHKTDKMGRPINIQTFGSIDIPALHKKVPAERHWETIVVSAEGMMRDVMKAASMAWAGGVDVRSVDGERIEGGSEEVNGATDMEGEVERVEVINAMCIVDLEGFGLRQFWGMKTLIRDSFQISQDYYPETMGKLVVINAPTSFAVIWSVVKGWLAKETVGKIEILGSNYREELLEMIDEEALPEGLGGSCRCMGGCERSHAGPWGR